MPPLPPWLNVSPHDFVLATQAGAQLGHQIASSTMQAWEEQARMRMAAQEAAANRESHAQQVAVENAMNRLAADRLEAYRQSEIANRQKELGLQQQGLGFRGQELGLQQQGLTMRGEREADLEEARLQRIKNAEQAAKDRQTQNDFMNEIRKGYLDIREKSADKQRPVTTKLAADEFGPELSGPIDSTEIATRLKQRADKLAADKAAPNPLVRAYNFLTGNTPAPPASTGTIPMNPVYPNPNNVAAPSPLSTAPVSSKVQKAKEIYQKHPDWSKQQVIDAVNSGLE